MNKYMNNIDERCLILFDAIEPVKVYHNKLKIRMSMAKRIGVGPIDIADPGIISPDPSTSQASFWVKPKFMHMLIARTIYK